MKACLTLIVLFLLATNTAWAADSLSDLIRQGDRQAALEMIRVGADVNEISGDGSSPLLWAVYAIDKELVELLLSREANPNVNNNYGANPLGEAVKTANLSIATMLLESGADVEAVNQDGQSALMLAARTGELDVVELLIRYGADVNARESWRGQTPLMWAVANSYADIARVLINNGAIVDIRADAFDWGSQITSEPRAQYRPTGGLTPLLYAARSGCLACVSDILNAGADINRPNPDGISPLIVAIDNLRFDTAMLLLERGANPHIWDWWGRTPLYVAVDINSYIPRGFARQAKLEQNIQQHTAFDIVTALLAAGVDPEPQLNMHRPTRGGNSGRFVDDLLTTGVTPLLRAANTHDVEAVRILLEYGANVELPNIMGVTPLIAAAGFGSARGVLRGTFDGDEAPKAVATLKVLLAAGADINARVTDTSSHNARIARISSMTDREGQTAIYGAISWGWAEVVEFLLEQGADFEVQDKLGKTPLDAAMGNAGGRVNRPVEAVLDIVLALKDWETGE